jgi:two-component SAPR family response regulator
MKSVIFVDDENLIVQSFNELLQMENLGSKVKIDTFTSKACGKETLHWLDDNKPDIAVLDIILNGVSGLDIAEKIMRVYPESMIIFLTGCEDSSEQVHKIKRIIEKRKELLYFNKLDDNWYDDIIDYIKEQVR